MTSQEGAPPLIYIPTLHSDLIDRQLPAGVLLLAPGLPITDGRAGTFTPANYPLAPKEAAAVLAELLSIGEALDLSDSKTIDSAREAFSGNAISPDEARDLAAFASPKASGNSPDSEKASLSPLIAAQKVVLLAWDLEDRLAEIRKLRAEVANAAHPLAAALGEASEEEGLSLADAGYVPDMADNAEPDWRVTLSAMAAFLPEDAVLVTAHEGMRASLLELGMLLPLPEDAAEKLSAWPDSLKAASLWAKAPLWRVIGHTKQPENAPWLANAPEIIVCPRAKISQGKKGIA